MAENSKIEWAEKFWGRVDHSSGLDVCWEWQGERNQDGYGRVWRQREHLSSHRVAWELTHGQTIPEGYIVLHSCDNPPCCNPAHLSVGTHADNSQDRDRKGRRVPVSGEDHWKCVLTAVQVEEIRASYTGARGELAALAKAYGVSYQHIQRIVNGESRKG